MFRSAAIISSVALILGAAPPGHGSADTGRPVAVGRQYPVLADGTSASGTGMLSVFGPVWTASFRLKDPGPIAVTRRGSFAYVVTAGGLAVIAGVNTAHPRIAATVRTGGTPGGSRSRPTARTSTSPSVRPNTAW